MVIHAGCVFVRSHDCFSPGVPYASRLVAVAPSPQILVTEVSLVAWNRAELPRLCFEVPRVGEVRHFGQGEVDYRVGRAQSEVG
ncbi:MAG: hypothetical protein IPL60_14710 [Ardenticatenia bacterium]|nr:hypothetical protein [Ardenticatenia bacterium]